MADRVEQILQEMVPELDDLSRKRIFTEPEIRQIVNRRRNFEYLLIRPERRPTDFLNYIRYEIALECLRRRRSKALHWKKKTISDYAGIRRVNFIFGRGAIRFKSDLRFWYQYIDFCLRSGSTRILSKVLVKALKFHPKEVHLWLLAADRDLKCGNIQAARTLLLRGLRNLPLSPRLWAELLKLEAQVAQKLLAKRRLNLSGDASARGISGAFAESQASSGQPQEVIPENSWAPARVILRRALAKLDTGESHDLAKFLTESAQCLQLLLDDPMGREGCEEFAKDLRQAIAERRPGIDGNGGAQAGDVDEATAVVLWKLWWNQERAQGRSWRAIVSIVAASAPPAGVQHCATSLMDAIQKGTGGKPAAALLELAASKAAAEEPGNAFAILESLEQLSMRNGAKADAATKAHLSLLNRALAATDTCSSTDPRLKLLLWKQTAGKSFSDTSGPIGMLRSGRDWNVEDVSRILTLVLVQVQDEDQEHGSEEEEEEEDQDEEQGHQDLSRTGSTTRNASTDLLVALDCLTQDAAAEPVVNTFLLASLARGMNDFCASCDSAVALAGTLWKVPRRRMEVLAAVLSAELRVHSPKDSAKRMCGHFEELLSCFDDESLEKVTWWVRYVEFAQRARQWGCADAIPSVNDLHWRAMRSVADQALYAEKVHRFLHDVI